MFSLFYIVFLFIACCHCISRGSTCADETVMLDWQWQRIGCLLQMTAAVSGGIIFMSVNTNEFDVYGDFMVVSRFFFIVLSA